MKTFKIRQDVALFWNSPCKHSVILWSSAQFQGFCCNLIQRKGYICLCALYKITLKSQGNRPKSFYFLFTPCYETAEKAPGCFLLPGSWNVQLLEVFKQHGEACTHCPCKGQLNSTVFASQSQEVSSSDKIKIVYSVTGQPGTFKHFQKGLGREAKKENNLFSLFLQQCLMGVKGPAYRNHVVNWQKKLPISIFACPPVNLYQSWGQSDLFCPFTKRT